MPVRSGHLADLHAKRRSSMGDKEGAGDAVAAGRTAEVGAGRELDVRRTAPSDAAADAEAWTQGAELSERRRRDGEDVFE